MQSNLASIIAFAAVLTQIVLAAPKHHRDEEGDFKEVADINPDRWPYRVVDLKRGPRGRHDGELARIVRRAGSLPSSWLECEQRWFGTAPFCDGECPAGWTADRRSSTADGCYQSIPTRIMTACFGLSSNHCTFGTKVLCEGNCVVKFADGRAPIKLTIPPPPRCFNPKNGNLCP